jgi:hypothetical protein
MLTDLIIKMENKNQQYIWNGIDLNGLREIMDPAADKAIDSIYESKSTDRLVKILQGMAENDSEISPELPKPMYDFIESELNIEFSEEDIQLFNEARKSGKTKEPNLFSFCYSGHCRLHIWPKNQPMYYE